MKNITIKALALTTITLSLGGCDFMQNHVGKYMPVIGEPCDNWQCVTSGGEAASKSKRMAREGQTTTRTSVNADPNMPATPTTPPATPAAAKTPTPFDMTPEELGEAPANPYGSQE